MTTFGPEIAVDGKRPEWAAEIDASAFKVHMYDGRLHEPTSHTNPDPWDWQWSAIRAIQLPESHRLYDSITLPRMTEAEAREWIERLCDALPNKMEMATHSWSRRWDAYRDIIPMVLKSLNLIRPESRAERFTRETGVEVTGDVLRALEWERE